MRQLKLALLGAAMVVALVLCVGALWKEWADARFYDGYDAELPLAAVVREMRETPEYTRIDFTYQSTPNSHVPTLLALPHSGAKPYPCIIFLHGIGQNRRFLDEIAGHYTKHGFAIASFDQYMRGERRLSSKNQLAQAFGLRRRLALNVIDTRRLVDYLQTRDDIAKNRIYLIGASFGAITGCTAVAFEPRIPAAVLTYGGGDMDLLLDSEAARKELGALYGPTRALVAYIMAPADPVKYVGKIAPRPLLFQNGRHDRLIPFAAAEALVKAAGDPKEFTVYDSDHVGMDPEQTLTVLEESVEWLREQDAKLLASTTPSVPVPASLSASSPLSAAAVRAAP